MEAETPVAVVSIDKQYIDLDDDFEESKRIATPNLRKRLAAAWNDARGASSNTDSDDEDTKDIEDGLVIGQQYYGRLDEFMNKIRHSKFYLIKVLLHGAIVTLVLAPFCRYALSMSRRSFYGPLIISMLSVVAYLFWYKEKSLYVASGKNIVLVILDDANALGIFENIIYGENNILVVYFNVNHSLGIESVMNSMDEKDKRARVSLRFVDPTELEGINNIHNLTYEFFDDEPIDAVIWTQHHQVKYDLINKYVDMNLNLNVVWPYFFLKDFKCKKVLMLSTPTIYCNFGDGKTHCCMQTWCNEIVSQGCVIHNPTGLMKYMSLARLLICKILREQNKDTEYSVVVLPMRDPETWLDMQLNKYLYDNKDVEKYVASLVWKDKLDWIELYDYNGPGRIPPFGNSKVLCKELSKSCSVVREKLKPYFKHDASKNTHRIRTNEFQKTAVTTDA